MASNLMSKGHNLVVYDIFPEAAAKLEASGALVASSPAEVGEKADTIITMLPNSQHVMEVYAGENGVFKTIKPGTLCMDSSTIDPGTSKEVAALAEAKRSIFLDTPVSGGVIGAKAATLTFMVGGPEKEFAAAKPVLSGMGKNIVYCGPIGSGQAVKICNNMLLGISMMGVSEAMNLGMRLGLDPKLLAGIINTSTGRCWSSELYNPVPGVLENVPSSDNYKGGFGTALIAKDLGLAQNLATRTGSAIPMGSLAHQFYRILTLQGNGNKDFSFIYQMLKEMDKHE